MERYIFAAKQGVHILDLDQTQKLLEEAGEYLFNIASKGGQIIFVCTKKQVAKIAADEARRCGALFMNERWVGGTITNYSIVKKSIDKLLGLKKKRDAGELSMYTKKERLLIDREIERLERFFGGVTELKGVPQAVVVVDAKREHTAINESRIFNVPVVALIDTNSDPTGIAKVIPGNDDAAKSVEKVLRVLSDCIEAGYKEFTKSKEPEVVVVAMDAPAEASTQETALEKAPAKKAVAKKAAAKKTKVVVSKVAKSAEKSKKKKK